MQNFIYHLWDYTWFRFAVIIMVVLGVYVSSLESAKALMRLGEGRLKRQRDAVNFAIEHFDELKDPQKDLITHDSLLLSKYRSNGAHAELVQTLLDKLDVYGHSTGTAGIGKNQRYVFALSRDDLKKAKNALG
jgi:hypothetical protein